MTIEGHKEIEIPVGVPVWDIDPYDPQILINPIDYYCLLYTSDAADE